MQEFASGLWRLVGGASSPLLAIIGPSRLEWYITDFACIFLGIPTVSATVDVYIHNTAYPSYFIYYMYRVLNCGSVNNMAMYKCWSAHIQVLKPHISTSLQSHPSPKKEKSQRQVN